MRILLTVPGTARTTASCWSTAIKEQGVADKAGAGRKVGRQSDIEIFPSRPSLSSGTAHRQPPTIRYLGRRRGSPWHRRLLVIVSRQSYLPFNLLPQAQPTCACHCRPSREGILDGDTNRFEEGNFLGIRSARS